MRYKCNSVSFLFGEVIMNRRLLTEIEGESDREDQKEKTEVKVKVPKGKKVTIDVDDENPKESANGGGRRLLMEG